MISRYGFMYVSISAGIIIISYITLWLSPDKPGSWKKAGKLRKSALHLSLWFLALSFLFGFISFGLTKPFYYFLPIILFESIASSIVCIEIGGAAMKSSIYWSDRKRFTVVVVLALILMGFTELLTIQARLTNTSALLHEREVPAVRPALFNDRLIDLIRAPKKYLGENRSSVQSKLGPPAAIRTKKIANIYIPSQIDQIHTLVYEGLDVFIYDAVIYNREMLFCVRMTENHPGKLPALIGQDEKTIKAIFGDPTRIRGSVFDYDIGEERVQIEFSDMRVVAVQWNLYLD